MQSDKFEFEHKADIFLPTHTTHIMPNDSSKQEIRYKMNVGPFMNAQMIAQLEPSLNNHYIGSLGPSISKYKSANPPPLPVISSSSDVYVKKIEMFKKKLKTFKGLSIEPKGKRPTHPSLNLYGEESHVKNISSNNITANTTLRSNSYILKGNRPNSSEWNGMIKNSLQNNNPINTVITPMLPTPPSVVERDCLATSSPTTPIFDVQPKDFQLPNTSKMVKKRSLVREQRCSICGLNLDSFYNIEAEERIIELECEHMVHEECLAIELEMNLSLDKIFVVDKSKIFEYLPRCGSCISCQKAVPKDGNVLNDLYTRMLTLHFEKPYKSTSTSSISAGSPITATFSDSSKFLDTEISSNSGFMLHQSNLNSNYDISLTAEFSPKKLTQPSIMNKQNKNIKGLDEVKESKQFNDSKGKLTKSTTYKTHAKKPSRGSYVSGTSAIVTSVSTNTSLNSAYSWNSNFPKDLLQKKFIEDLIKLAVHKKIQALDDHEIVLNREFLSSLGDLRLFDKIKLAFSVNDANSTLTEYYCYLFDHMLLVLDSKEFNFFLISINLSVFIELLDDNTLILKASRNTKEFYKFKFFSKILRDKWVSALKNVKLDFDSGMLTSTIEMDEYDDMIDEDIESIEDMETIGTLQSYVGGDGYRRLQTGVCPRFYEGTINSLIFSQKPSKAVLVLNQTKEIPSSVTPIKNIIKSLSMIGIDIYLVLCSTSLLSMDSNVLDSYELKKEDFKQHAEDFLCKLDDYQKYLSKNSGERIEKENKNIRKTISYYLETSSSSLEYGDIISVIISNTSLINVRDIPTMNNIMIEVGLDLHQKSNRADVSDLADWDDAMEVICVCCGLEFDESDFCLSSVDDDSCSDSDDADNNESNIFKSNHEETANITDQFICHTQQDSEINGTSVRDSLECDSNTLHDLYNDLNRALEQL